MTDIRPYDWDEDRSANLELIDAYRRFDVACTVQEEISAVYDSYIAANTLRDRAEVLRSRKWIIWSDTNSYGGLYNPAVALNHLCTIAHNGLLEWRARRLHVMADNLSGYPEPE